MPRGGRRPGAGAPKGNLNALRTGASSARVRAILAVLMRDEEAREVLLRLGASGRGKNHYARELALAMARFMHDQPVGSELQRRLDDIADNEFLAHETREVQTRIAEFEQATGRDAYSGRPLARRPSYTPEQRERLARLTARLAHHRRQLELLRDFAEPEPEGFIGVLDA